MLDRRQPVAQQVYEILRERIVALELAPGAPLSRPGLAREFGVSATPVREALLRLEAERLIEVYPQVRTEVAAIDIDMVREFRFLRRALESEVVATLAAHPTPLDLSALRAHVGAQRDLVDDDAAMARFDALDRAFHRVLFGLAGQLKLHDMMVRQSAHQDRVRRLQIPEQGKRASIVAEHAALIEAIESRDPAAAVAALRAHLGDSASRLDEIIARHAGLFARPGPSTAV